MGEVEKVYIIHGGGLATAADFFVKRVESLNEEEEDYWMDYKMENCEYVQKFLEEHPDFKYVGSSDDMHYDGWGVDFEGWTEVDCPKLKS